MDVDFGPVSQLAMRVFGKLVKLSVDNVVTKPLAQALIENSSASLLPSNLEMICWPHIKYMQLKDYWVARPEVYLNIVMSRARTRTARPTSTHLTCGRTPPRHRVKNRKPTIVGIWNATTSGIPPHAREDPKQSLRGSHSLRPVQGLARRIHNRRKRANTRRLFGGRHHRHRDRNKDMQRTEDKTE